MVEVERKMSTRPVPRRDSPWGLPEGDTRQPKAHRCNDRAEDVIQVCILCHKLFFLDILWIILVQSFVLLRYFKINSVCRRSKAG